MTKPIHTDTIAIGAAHREGRAPQHDGEYISIYYRPGDSEYVAIDNAGLAWSSYGEQDVLDMADHSDEMYRQIAEAQRIVAANTGSPVYSIYDMSPAALDAARAMGWPLPN